MTYVCARLCIFYYWNLLLLRLEPYRMHENTDIRKRVHHRTSSNIESCSR